MKSHHMLLRKVLKELGTWCGTSTDRDWKTITDRLEHEGESFLMISLPQFAKDFERSLELKAVTTPQFLSFKSRGCLPEFLRGFTSQVFSPSTGVLLDTPNETAIYSVRQICNLLSKVELPCSDARERAAFRQYIETDQEVKRHVQSFDFALLDKFEAAAWQLWDNGTMHTAGKREHGILSAMDKSIYEGNIVPKHGPGATADRIRGNAKFRQQVWTQRLEEIFPHGEFLFPNWRHYDADRVELLGPEAEIPVRVISVPKTQKTPRIIAIEPTAVQYVQQGLWECFLTEIERHDTLSILVGFRDQGLNQDLAKQGSIDGSLATLDLSEASDRVSYRLVQALTSKYAWVTRAFDAARSRKADVPGFGIHSLFKYASMGSALCFPVEAMVFTTIIFMSIAEERNTSVSQLDLSDWVGKVRVYGDDLIVPVEYVHRVIANLEAFGLKVNTTKSFWTGKFRESCGKEYYNGFDVSIVKLRALFPTSRKHVSELVSLVSFRNQLYKAGLHDTTDWLDEYIGRLIPFPIVFETSPVLGRHNFFGHSPERMCNRLQRPLVRGYVVTEVIPNDPLEDDPALLKCFLKRGDKPFADKRHLERAGRPRAVNIKLGWGPLY